MSVATVSASLPEPQVLDGLVITASAAILLVAAFWGDVREVWRQRVSNLEMWRRQLQREQQKAAEAAANIAKLQQKIAAAERREQQASPRDRQVRRPGRDR